MARARSVLLAMTAAAATSFDASDAAQATYTYAGAGASIRRIVIQLPPGSQGTLHLDVKVVGRAGGRPSAVEYGAGGDQYISGDDVLAELDTDFPVNTGDVIQAWYDNTDQSNAHWFGMTITIG